MIKAAAIKLKSGKVLIGKSHADCFESSRSSDFENSIQGFITYDDEFVDRKRAAEIAFEYGQIREQIKGVLMSEDIWDTGACDYVEGKGYLFQDWN